jgi:DNA-directed RNA polymerase subunit M/transcription elongation factor TFIIS
MKCKNCGNKMDFFGVNGNSGDKYHCSKCYNIIIAKSSGLKRKAGSESKQPPKKVQR